MSQTDKNSLRDSIAIACRMLGHFGLANEVTGHISVRTASDRMLVRCRSQDEAGVIFTNSDAIREVDFSGNDVEDNRGYEKPTELPIHGEILRNRPDINAVVHCHPYASLICGMANLELKPIFGAYDPPTTLLAIAGIPVFPRPILIQTSDLARELIDAMNSKSVCLLKGHGIVTVGASAEEATLNAIRLESLAAITLDLHRITGKIEPLAQEDIQYFSTLRRTPGKLQSRGSDWTWRHYVKLLEREESGRFR